MTAAIIVFVVAVVIQIRAARFSSVKSQDIASASAVGSVFAVAALILVIAA